MIYQSNPLKYSPKESFMKLKQKQYRLEKLKEERDRKNNTLRWGVKSRDIKLPNYFRGLRESLQVNKKGRLI